MVGTQAEDGEGARDVRRQGWSCVRADRLLHIKHTNFRVIGRLAAHSTHSTAICQPPHPSDNSGLRPNLQ